MQLTEKLRKVDEIETRQWRKEEKDGGKKFALRMMFMSGFSGCNWRSMIMMYVS